MREMVACLRVVRTKQKGVFFFNGTRMKFFMIDKIMWFCYVFREMNV